MTADLLTLNSTKTEFLLIGLKNLQLTKIYNDCLNAITLLATLALSSTNTSPIQTRSVSTSFLSTNFMCTNSYMHYSFIKLSYLWKIVKHLRRHPPPSALWASVFGLWWQSSPSPANAYHFNHWFKSIQFLTGGAGERRLSCIIGRQMVVVAVVVQWFRSPWVRPWTGSWEAGCLAAGSSRCRAPCDVARGRTGGGSRARRRSSRSPVSSSPPPRTASSACRSSAPPPTTACRAPDSGAPARHTHTGTGFKF